MVCRNADPHPLESVAVGVAARTVAGISLLPVTVVKVRLEVNPLSPDSFKLHINGEFLKIVRFFELQSGQFKYSGMYSALRSIGKVEGVRGETTPKLLKKSTIHVNKCDDVMCSCVVRAL